MEMKLWKGKCQSEKQYNRRLKQVENGKRRKKVTVEPESECVVDGRLILDIKVMLAHMHCSFCKDDLLLKNMVWPQYFLYVAETAS